MNSLKAQCQWCFKMYATAGGYSNHIQKNYSEHVHFTTVALKRQRRDSFKALPDSQRDIILETKLDSTEAQWNKYSANSNLDNYDLHREELARICNAYPDFETVPEISEREASDVEPSVGTRSLSNSNPYTSDIIRSPTNQFKAGQAVKDFLFSQQRSKEYNHLYPFHNSQDYKLAHFFILSKVSKEGIDQFFRDKLIENPMPYMLFKSGHTFYQQADKMAEDPAWTAGSVQYALRPKSEFQYRNIIECIQYLLCQWAFVDHMLWKPVEVFNKDGERIYSELNTGSWWWDQQVCLLVTLNLSYNIAVY